MTYSSLRIEIECPQCECPRFTMIAASKPGAINTRSAAVIKCADCGKDWSISATLARADNTSRAVGEDGRHKLDLEDVTEPRELRECGTNAAWSRHQRAGETPCEACRIAHNRYVAARAKARRERTRAA
jgi:hypothetical protein